jgi:hypothetical protein
MLKRHNAIYSLRPNLTDTVVIMPKGPHSISDITPSPHLGRRRWRAICSLDPLLISSTTRALLRLAVSRLFSGSRSPALPLALPRSPPLPVASPRSPRPSRGALKRWTFRFNPASVRLFPAAARADAPDPEQPDYARR